MYVTWIDKLDIIVFFCFILLKNENRFYGDRLIRGGKNNGSIVDIDYDEV
jgi:hypothetical protein